MIFIFKVSESQSDGIDLKRKSIMEESIDNLIEEVGKNFEDEGNSFRTVSAITKTLKPIESILMQVHKFLYLIDIASEPEK